CPTRCAAAECTPSSASRAPARGSRGGGAGANLHAIVYEPELTLGLPVPQTVGTSLNALAHAAEALYVPQRAGQRGEDALTGAALIGEWLPRVVERPADPVARERLL